MSIAATRTTRWSLPPADEEPAVLEAAQHWVPLFAPRGTVLANAKCLLSRKPLRIEHNVDYQQQHVPRVLLHGVQPDAMSGGAKAAVTIQSAEKEVPVTKELAGGLTT